MIRVEPVILCGGSGSRLWPISRLDFPKPFISIGGGASLFQKTIRRVSQVQEKDFSVEYPIVVLSKAHASAALSQLRELGVPERLITEPYSKNTAPALTLAAFYARERGNDPVLFVTPADHFIGHESEYCRLISNAVRLANEGALVTLGVTPTAPETGYGYIKSSLDVGSMGESDVIQFVEKPSLDLARRYISDGGYLWNAGLFVVRASVWLSAMSKVCSQSLEILSNSWSEKNVQGHCVSPDSELFSRVGAISIDNAVMERADELGIPVKVVRMEAGWKDLGSWDSIGEKLPADDDANHLFGNVILNASKNNVVYATDRLVTCLGVEDLVIAETHDAVLVLSKSSSQDVQKVFQNLKEQARPEIYNQRIVHRPWGYYGILHEGEGFKVKRISVDPGQKLSLQSHTFRSEHWVVVSGEAVVTRGEETFTLASGKSTFIPAGLVHRLENSSMAPLEVVEIQSGSYLEEDDIVRYEDIYGRDGSVQK